MKKIILFIASVGWLVPLWVHYLALDSWYTSEVLPILNGAPQLNSFPHYQFSQQLLLVAGIWLSAVIVCWAGYLIFKGSADGNS
jgi:hypothetical protein